MAGDQSIIAPVGVYRLPSHRAAAVNALAGILRGSMRERAWLNTHLYSEPCPRVSVIY